MYPVWHGGRLIYQYFPQPYYPPGSAPSRQRSQDPGGGNQPSAPSPHLPTGPAPSSVSASQSRSNTPKPRSARKQNPQPTMAQQPTFNPSENGNGPPQFFQNQQHGHFMPPFPMPFPGMHVPGNHNNNFPQSHPQPQQSSALVSRYTEPHPRMYPFVPPGNEPMPQPQMSNQPNFPGSSSNAIIPTALPSPALFNQAIPGHASFTPMTTNPDALKYKCGICGRIRSPRYHYKHPLAPGQLPKRTVCRRCRKEETDSEDEGTNSDDEREHRARSRARSTARSRSRAASVRPLSRARSSSRRGRRNFDFDYYSSQDLEISSSDSDVSDLHVPRRRTRRTRRSRVPSVEIHRYVDVVPEPRKKVVYLESRGNSYDYSDEEDDGVELRYVDEPRALVASRPGTPARRRTSRYRRDQAYSSQEMAERPRNYYNGPIQQATRLPRSVSRSGFRNRYHPARSSSRHRLDDLEYRYPETMREIYTYEPLVREEKLGLDVRHGRSRSRSRFSIDEGAESGPILPEEIPRTLRRRRSMSNTRADRNIATDGAQDAARPASTNVRRGATQETSKDSASDRALSDDYDWYDSSGMRVRVREI